MVRRPVVLSSLSSVFLLVSVTAVRAQQFDAVPVYAQYCAQCHDKPESTHAPSREELYERSPESILAALTTGKMSVQGSALTDRERRGVALLLSGRPFGASAASAAAMPNKCAVSPAGNLLDGPSWSGWSNGVANTRFQRDPGFTAAQVPKLTLKWAFGLPNGTKGQPTLVGGRIYIGSDAGFVYAIDAASGCVHWSFEAKAGVRTAISAGPVKTAGARTAVYFGDIHANMYAVNAETGSLLWTVRVEKHALAGITGTPTLHGGRLYVPVTSAEEAAAWPREGGSSQSQQYECCTFRGSLVALDATTGRQIWKSYTIPRAPEPTKKTSNGTQLYGPSGAAIWSAPTIDVKRRMVYVATGNAYSAPAEGSHNAVIAYDLATGERRWTQQPGPNDVFIFGCSAAAGLAPGKTPAEACPESLGPDFDFGGGGVIMGTLPNGRTILTAGQKSGVAWGFDPDKQGKVLWQQRVGSPGKMDISGGVVWGTATDGERAYFSTNDGSLGRDAGGLSAVKLADGALVWNVKPPCVADKPCTPAQPGAITVIPGAVFASTVDGVLRAYSTANGQVVWEYDVKRDFQTVNGVPGKGTGLRGPGAVVAGGLMLIPTNNVLLAFTVGP